MDVSAQVADTSRVLARRVVTRHALCVTDETRYEGAQVLRERREYLELTQQELADKAVVSLSSISRIEGGKRIDRKVERKVARALGLEDHGVDAAYRGEPLPIRSAESALDAAQVEAKQLELETMTDEEMERVAEFVAEVRGDPAEKYALMADMLRARDARRRARQLTQRDSASQA